MQKLYSCNILSTHRAAQPFTPRYAAPERKCTDFRQAVKTRAWTQVIDQASGKPYYWNTATNETAWELPPSLQAALAAEPTTSSHTTTTVQDTGSSSSSPLESTSKELTPEALFKVLAEAYTADGSGMEFWEVARAHRSHGVFDPPFFDYLEQRQKAAGDPAGQDLAFKMMCRLSNPLLRQPAPFE